MPNRHLTWQQQTYAPENPNLQYGVVNAPDGVYSRNSPHTEDTPKVAGQGVYNGDTVQLICGITNGDAVGENDNNTWHKVKNLTRPEQPDFWLNDYHIASPNVADQLVPGEPVCEGESDSSQSLQGGSANSNDLQNTGSIPEGSYASVPKGCYFNMKWPKRNLTFSYLGDHRYYGNAWQAAKNWTDLNAGISITPVPANVEADIVIEDVSVEYDRERGPWVARVVMDSAVEYAPKLIQQNPGVINDQMRVLANTFNMEGQNDYQRTYTFTHEIGHILGIAHIDDEACSVPGATETQTIMMSGRHTNIKDLKFNKPQPHDKAMLQYIYGS